MRKGVKVTGGASMTGLSKDTVVKVPANLFRTMYSSANGSTTTKVGVTTRTKKQFNGLRITDGIETFLVIPTTASLR